MAGENEVHEIGKVLSTYEKALNASDATTVMKLYAKDGVFMPPYNPSSVGTDAVRRAYDNVFKMIKLTVKFHIEEIHQIASDWAFARTNSAGKTKTLATGKEQPEANQELFLFQKIDGEWKIARYSFSTTNPPKN